jgi:hypothetical protein
MALGEGMENMGKPWILEPLTLPQQPEAQAAVSPTLCGTFSMEGIKHMTQSTGLMVSKQALAKPRKPGAENSLALGSQHESSQLSTSNVAVPTLTESAPTCWTVRQPGGKERNVWSAFLCARHELTLEMQRLRTARREHVQDAVAVLSSMLRDFSKDVLLSRHIRSAAAAAAVAPSAPAGLSGTQKTEVTQTAETHSELASGCSRSLERQNRGRMSTLHARGIMHAMEHVSAIHTWKFTSGGTTEPCAQLPDIDAGGAGKGRSWQVQGESCCDFECIEASVTGAGFRDPPTATLGTMPQTVKHNGRTWQEV